MRADLHIFGQNFIIYLLIVSDEYKISVCNDLTGFRYDHGNRKISTLESISDHLDNLKNNPSYQSLNKNEKIKYKSLLVKLKDK